MAWTGMSTLDAVRPALKDSSVQSLDRLGRRRGKGGGMRDDSAKILFQSFQQEALLSKSGIGRDVHSLMVSI